MSCLDLPPLPQSSREAPPVYRWSDAARLADDELMRLVARGDARALEHLYARHAAPAILPREQRRTVELAYLDGRTHREIAGLLDLPVGTVKGRLRLGLDKLRQALAAEAA